jgi:hypothetical protein
MIKNVVHEFAGSIPPFLALVTWLISDFTSNDGAVARKYSLISGFRLTDSMIFAMILASSLRRTLTGAIAMVELAPSKAPAPEFLRLTTDVVAAYLRNNSLPTAQIREIINAVYRSLRTLEE